jgi:tetratricopeptide (TPR) repeat protein
MPASTEPRNEGGNLNLLDERRSAHASIRGYLYQTCLGVLRWLDLKENEILLCEGDEDLDRFLLGGGAVSEQVKAYTGGLSITDRVVRDSLRNFLLSYVTLRQRGENRKFVFTTTAYEKRTKGLDFDLLEKWRKGNRTSKVLSRVRSLVAPVKNDPKKKDIEEARVWLDKEAEGWKGFMDAVEWSFGAPDLDALRGEIERKLQAERSALSSVVLLDRLIVAVLKASSQKEVEKRILTKTDVDAQVGAFLADLGKAASSEAVRIRSVFEEIDNLRDLLDEGTRELSENPTPGQTLTAAFEVIPFQETGRQEELAFLASWCENKSRHSVLLLTGEGGSGKTRFMLEWCRRLRHQGWHAGFLKRNRESDQILPLVKGTAPRLVVIDYAETRLRVVGPLLVEMGQAPQEGPKVRLVLLARREADWWKNLSLLSGDVAELLTRSEHRSLSALASEDLAERQHAFQNAVEGFAEGLGRQMPKHLNVPHLSGLRFDHALYLHMAALAALQGEQIETAEDALEQTLAHERRFWRSQVEDLELDRPQGNVLVKGLETAVAAVTLVGGTATLEQSQTLLDRVLKPLPLLPHHNGTVLNLLRDLYQGLGGGARHHLDPLQPDLLGEQWIAEALDQDNSLLGRVLDGASPEEGYQILTVLTRLARRRPDKRRWIKAGLHERLEQLGETALDVAISTGDPIGMELADELAGSSSIDVVLRVQERCNEEKYRSSVPLREVAHVVTERGLALLRERRTDLDETQLSEYARLANNLGVRLSNLGRREDALGATQEAVDIRRQLALLRPDAFRPHLASGLNNLGNRLSDLGRREDALLATQEAVEIYRGLARQRPDAFLPDLARSLNNLGNRLSDLGRREDALVATNEAVEIRRQLARQRPDAFLPDLATSLNNLGNRFRDLGRREDALVPTNEAVEIRRQLARQRPDAFLPDLARSLKNLGTILSALGRREDAFQAAEEAVRILAPFFLRLPAAFAPWMSMLVKDYLARSESAGKEPDEALLAPIAEAFRSLSPGSGVGGEIPNPRDTSPARGDRD